MQDTTKITTEEASSYEGAKIQLNYDQHKWLADKIASMNRFEGGAELEAAARAKAVVVCTTKKNHPVIPPKPDYAIDLMHGTVVVPDEARLAAEDIVNINECLACFIARIEADDMEDDADGSQG